MSLVTSFAQTSLTVDANGNVINGKATNFPTGKLKVNGVVVGTNFSDLHNVGAGKTIYVDGINGDDSTGARGQQNKPFLTVTAAKAATGITSGDIIKVGPGTFTISDDALILNGISIIGAGKGKTVLQGTASDSLVISLGGSASLQSVTVKVLRLENIQNSSAETCYITDTEVIGVDDCVFLGQDNDGTLEFNSYNSTFRSSFDTIVILNNGTPGDAGVVANFYNSAAEVSGHSSGEQAHAIITHNGSTVRWFAGQIKVDGTQNSSDAIGAISAGGAIEIYGARVDVTGPDGFTYDLENSGGDIFASSVVRPDGGALVTLGTITDISRYATRDKNLSDLADSATARSNLGLVIGTNVQAYNANLTTWAGITPGSGVGTALAINLGSAGAFGRHVAVPSTASSSGTGGDYAYDSSFFYICTTTNTWKRVAISTW